MKRCTTIRMGEGGGGWGGGGCRGCTYGRGVGESAAPALYQKLCQSLGGTGRPHRPPPPRRLPPRPPPDPSRPPPHTSTCTLIPLLLTGSQGCPRLNVSARLRRRGASGAGARGVHGGGCKKERLHLLLSSPSPSPHLPHFHFNYTLFLI